MTLTPGLRKLALTAHVSFSVGWLGAVAAFLALALDGLTGTDELKVRAAYLSMASVTRLVLVPLSLASLVSGLFQALGTEWGLFRHYWVVAKLLLTVLATAILLLHTQAIQYMADAAAQATVRSPELRETRVQLVAAAGAGLLVLLVTTTLSVLKPRGMTRYGRRKNRESGAALAIEGCSHTDSD